MNSLTRTESTPDIKGRGALSNPVSRFERLSVEIDPEWLDYESDHRLRTEYFIDNTQKILARNDSPDISFDYSINPYRGCEHGCVYCYARPTHEYFGLSAGLDFETKIMVKPGAPELLEQALQSRRWQPQVIALSGNTDPYQPVERSLRISRRCLKVLSSFRNPVSIITKNALIVRDLDLLQELAKYNLVSVTLSITTLDHQLARTMEPRTSAPARRLEALERIAAAGVPTNVNIAPLIPGLNEAEMPAILREASERGAQRAAYILLRLPHSVKELFGDWLRKHYPERENKILNAVRETRAGRLNDPCFSSRHRGEGVRAEAIRKVFELSCQKLGLNRTELNLSIQHFRRGHSLQTELF